MRPAYVCGGSDTSEMLSPAELLAFEARWPRPSGIKDEAIRREFGVTPVRYYVLMMRAAESADGIAADPFTARRVRDALERRARIRSHRTLQPATLRA